MTRVDCIIPVYQPDPSELAIAVKSVLAQTVPCTITLVDDGSDQDGKRAIQDVVSGTSINLITLGENHGCGAARNMGASVGQAEFVWFCDADDWAEPTFLAAAIAAFDRDPTAVFTFSGVNFIGKLPAVSKDDQRLSVAIQTIPGNKVFRRWAFLQAAGFGTGPGFRTSLGGEDAALVRCLSLFGRHLTVDQPLYNKRVKPGDHFWRFIEQTRIGSKGEMKLAISTEDRAITSSAIKSRFQNVRRHWQKTRRQITG